MTNKDLIMELVNNLEVGAKNAEIIAKILDCDMDGNVCDVVEVKHGEWIEEAFKMICPFCNTYFSTINTPINVFKGYYHFCPYCGADMRGETE